MITILTATLVIALTARLSSLARPNFDKSKDLLLAQYDGKPDPDDLHAQAAAGCMLLHPEWKDLNVYAVAGAYGIQNGIYMDSSSLFTMVFGKKNTGWTDAHTDWAASVKRIMEKVQAGRGGFFRYG